MRSITQSPNTPGVLPHLLSHLIAGLTQFLPLRPFALDPTIMPKKKEKEKGKERAVASKRLPPKLRSAPSKGRSAPTDPSTQDLLAPPPPWTPDKVVRRKLTSDEPEESNVAAASSTSEYHIRYDDDSDIDYDDILGGIADDSEDEFNTSFPKDKSRSKLRVAGGTACPDISMMSDEEGAKVLKQWKVERTKAFTDKVKVTEGR